MGIACDACHFNYTTLITHSNGTLDTTDPAVTIVFFDAVTNPTGTWNNAAGSCSSLNCHGTDILDWYGPSAANANYTSCPSCHVYPLGARRRITGTGGDFRVNPAIVSNHVTTTGDPVPAQCLVCHDHTLHTLGTVLLRNADTGASLAYDAATPSSLEPFCLSCHDADGALATALSGTAASPFNDGVTLGSGRNVAGNKIESYWNGSFTIHKGFSLTCAGGGSPATGLGCHGNNRKINMHGSISKGLLTQNLTLPVPYTAPFAYNDYKLCFDCHSNFAPVSPQVVLGYKAGGNYDVAQVPPINSYVTSTATIQSLFREQYINPANPSNFPVYWSGVSPFYNDTMSIDKYPYLPLHNYHLTSIVTNTLFSPLANWLSWKYRGDPTQAGRISCVACHNVHGTNGLSARSTFDEFGISTIPLPGVGVDLYNTMAPSTYDPAVMGTYPMNCNADCHGNAGQTFYWNSPANE